LDGHVLLTRVTDYQRGQTNDHDVRSVLGGANVQRTTRRRVPCQPKQQLLLGAVAHYVIPMRIASRLRHRLDRTIMALWPILAVQENLSHIHQLDQEGCA